MFPSRVYIARGCERVNFLVLRRATLEPRQMALEKSTLLRLTLIAANSSVIISIMPIINDV